MMITTKTELLDHLSEIGNLKIKKAKIVFHDYYSYDLSAVYLGVDGDVGFRHFLFSIENFNYFPSNVLGYITGTIWFEDGSYSTHEDFGNGVEKWVYHENGCSCRFCECKIVWDGAFYFKDLNP